MFVKLHFSATSPGTSNHDSWKSEKNGGRTRTSRFFHGARRKYILVPVGDAAFLYSTHISLKINPDLGKFGMRNHRRELVSHGSHVPKALPTIKHPHPIQREEEVRKAARFAAVSQPRPSMSQPYEFAHTIHGVIRALAAKPKTLWHASKSPLTV